MPNVTLTVTASNLQHDHWSGSTDDESGLTKKSSKHSQSSCVMKYAMNNVKEIAVGFNAGQMLPISVQCINISRCFHHFWYRRISLLYLLKMDYQNQKWDFQNHESNTQATRLIYSTYQDRTLVEQIYRN